MCPSFHEDEFSGFNVAEHIEHLHGDAESETTGRLVDTKNPAKAGFN
jgi:hypothetical protein